MQCRTDARFVCCQAASTPVGYLQTCGGSQKWWSQPGLQFIVHMGLELENGSAGPNRHHPHFTTPGTCTLPRVRMRLVSSTYVESISRHVLIGGPHRHAAIRPAQINCSSGNKQHTVEADQHFSTHANTRLVLQAHERCDTPMRGRKTSPVLQTTPGQLALLVVAPTSYMQPVACWPRLTLQTQPHAVLQAPAHTNDATNPNHATNVRLQACTQWQPQSPVHLGFLQPYSTEGNRVHAARPQQRHVHGGSVHRTHLVAGAC